MIGSISSGNETEFHFILNLIKEIRAVSKSPDNQAILDHINEASARNMGHNHVGEIINYMLEN